MRTAVLQNMYDRHLAASEPEYNATVELGTCISPHTVTRRSQWSVDRHRVARDRAKGIFK